MTVVPIEDRSAFAVAQSGRMSPAVVKQQAEEIRELMRSALVEGVDFGRIPNTPMPTLFQPGAQWMLKWAGYGFRNQQAAVVNDGAGRPYGVTYTCSVHILGSAPEVVVATCDGYCGYDEPDREEHPTRDGKRVIARSPWNTIVKMAQKRALVGAALAATGASGIFTQDVEDAGGPVVDPDEEFKRHGWKSQAEADEVRTRQMKRIKDDKLAKEFAAWRQQDSVKVPAFSDGWHSKKEADQIDAWFAILDADKALADAAAGQATPSEANGEPPPPETPKEAAPTEACEHDWFEQEDGSLVCPACGEVKEA